MMKMLALLAVSCCWIAPIDAQELYFTDGSGAASTVDRADLDGMNQMTLASTGVNSADGIRVDVAGGKLYWAEQTGNIRRANIDGTNIELVAAAGGNPHAIALDLLAGKVYWTELAANRIRRANLDGTGVEFVVAATNADGLAVDPVGGKIYWTSGSRIRRANTNGTGTEVLYNNGTPHGLALDVAAGKLYIANLGNGRIQRGDMDGSGVIENLVSGLSTPLDISLDLVPGKMYWSELGGGGSIKRANLNGSGAETLIGSGVTGVFGITLSPTLPVPVPLLPRGAAAALFALLLAAGSVLVARSARARWARPAPH